MGIDPQQQQQQQYQHHQLHAGPMAQQHLPAIRVEDGVDELTMLSKQGLSRNSGTHYTQPDAPSLPAYPISINTGGSSPAGSSPRGASPLSGSPRESHPMHLLMRKSFQRKALSQQQLTLSSSCPSNSMLAPPKEAEHSGERKGGVGRSISAMFKGALFKSSLFNANSSSNQNAINHLSSPSSFVSSSNKPGTPLSGWRPAAVDTDLAVEAGTMASSPARPYSLEKPSMGKGQITPKDSFSLKSMFNTLQNSSSATTPPQPSSPAAPGSPSHGSPAPACPTPVPPACPAPVPPACPAPVPPACPDLSKLQIMSQKSMDFAAAAEAEAKANAARRASISARVTSPSMLLVVTKDLPARMSRPIWNLKDYVVLEKMYTGYASNVYKARCKHSGVLVCLKSYTLGNLCELNRFQIFREVKLHSSLCHEHVIKLYGAFQQADQVVLVQEYAGIGDLFSLLHRYGGRLPERSAVELVLQPFLTVINYLHSNGIAHRDIKPENILYTSDMRLKLCDFGLAINMREEKAVTRAGTLEYMAPEVLDCPFKNKPEENKGNEMLHYSYHVDTWAVGVLTYELLVGLPPFNDKQRNAVEDKIRLAPPKFPSKMSEQCRDFITMALDKNPLERPTVMEMLTHPWIKMHRRSNSVQHLSSCVNHQNSSATHSTSQVTECTIMEGPEGVSCDGQAPQQPPSQPQQPMELPSVQATVAVSNAVATQLPNCMNPPRPPEPAAAPMSIHAPVRVSVHHVKMAGAAQGDLISQPLSSSYTAGALPLTAYPGMAQAGGKVKGAAASTALLTACPDKHTAQQQQQRQQLLRQRLAMTTGRNSSDCLAPVADTQSPLPRPHASFLSFSSASSKALPPLSALHPSPQPAPSSLAQAVHCARA